MKRLKLFLCIALMALLFLRADFLRDGVVLPDTFDWQQEFLNRGIKTQAADIYIDHFIVANRRTLLAIR